MKKKAPWNENAKIRSAIRRVFSQSPIVREVMMKVRREVPKFNKDGSRAKKDAVQYQCGVCKTWTKSTAISVDHIEPVIPEWGFEDWNTFVYRLFCKADNLQVICDDCHQKKTNAERLARTIVQDTESIRHLGISMSCGPGNFLEDVCRKELAKYSKKLSIYPDETQQEILRLKALLGTKKTKNPSKSSKGNI
jgi:5-methylcytosine-specific restriction endonuclease McrA